MRLLSTMASLIASVITALGLSGCSKDSQRMPQPEELFGTPLSEEADQFLTACNTEFNEKQQALHERWLAGHERYDVDLERGVLSLSRMNRAPILFDVEVVGSFSSSGNSWEWAWNNPNVAQSIAVPRAPLAAVGQEYGLKYLLSGFVPVPEKRFPYYLSGIALKVRGALGVYEVPSEDLVIFLLLRNPREGDS
jgi:hypothetical protein